MKYEVTIQVKGGVFPIDGLNELLNGKTYNYRTRKYVNPVKAKNDSVCIKCIYAQLKNVKLKTPIKCHYHIYTKDKRHDRGNVYSAVEKSFLDALQKCGCLKNDGFNDVLDSTFYTEVDSKRPRVEIIIEEV